MKRCSVVEPQKKQAKEEQEETEIAAAAVLGDVDDDDGQPDEEIQNDEDILLQSNDYKSHNSSLSSIDWDDDDDDDDGNHEKKCDESVDHNMTRIQESTQQTFSVTTLDGGGGGAAAAAAASRTTTTTDIVPTTLSTAATGATAPTTTTATTTTAVATTVATAEREREVLLLVLLAQVCALHDPTPRTFTVHVLDWFERGILDRKSISFLFEVGLVPQHHHHNQQPSQETSHHHPSPQSYNAATEASLAATSSSPAAATTMNTNHSSSELAIVPANANNHPMTAAGLRSMEASAIRRSLQIQELEEEEEQQKTGGGQQRQSQQKQQPQRYSNNHPYMLAPSASRSPSTAADGWETSAHPLCFSRYQREFHQVRPLASGSFGQVFQATNKLDGRDYAIKQVLFSAQGYSRESLYQVIREVHCLAACDHPNIVRYYTSWLEPSWMTGSNNNNNSAGETKPRGKEGKSSKKHANKKQQQQQHYHHKLLTSIQNQLTSSLLDNSGSGGSSSLDELRGYFKDPNIGFHRPRRTASFDTSQSTNFWEDDDDDDDSDDDDYMSDSAYSHSTGNRYGFQADEDDDDDDDIISWDRRSRDDSCLDQQRRKNTTSPKKQKQQQRRRKQQSSYRYKICLFIQMQLCHPATLADWIRERNRQQHHQSWTERMEAAAEIFQHILLGLQHIHAKGIIHRDLKPSNVFCSMEHGGFQCKIGDFGLSKLIMAAESTSPPSATKSNNKPSALHHHLLLEYDKTNLSDSDRTPVQGHKQQKYNSPPRRAGDNHPWNTSNRRPFDEWEEPHTAGVGTASYSAPEQVNSRNYGTEADIFSVGLILLELLCCFSTQHERLQTFHDCRHRRSLRDALEKHFPVAARTILACTESNPQKRPSASELIGIDIRQRRQEHQEPCTTDSSNDDDALVVETVVTNVANDSTTSDVDALKAILATRERELKQCKEELIRKDQIIADLSRQVEQLKRSASRTTNNTNSMNGGSSTLPISPGRAPSGGASVLTFLSGAPTTASSQPPSSSASSSTSDSDDEI